MHRSILHSYTQPIIRALHQWLLISAGCLLIHLSAQAQTLHIHVNAPNAEFIFNPQALTHTEATLHTDEHQIAKRIQPLLKDKKYQDVIQAFNAYERDVPRDNMSAALVLLKAQVLMTLKQFDAAKSAFEYALTQQAHLHLAHHGLSLIYLQEDNAKRAQHHLRQLIAIGKADAQTYAQLAYVNLQLHQPASAIAGYQQALFLNADEQQWQHGLLYALIESGAWSQAASLLDELIAKQPDIQRLWLQRAQIALQQQQMTQAISSLEQAHTLGQQHAENSVNLSLLHLEYGDPTRAIELMQHVLKNNTADTEENTHTRIHQALVQMADWFVNKQQWAALNQLLTAIEQHKTIEQRKKPWTTHQQSRWNTYRAQRLFALNRSKKALNYAQKALKQDATNGNVLLLIAQIYKAQYQHTQASLYFQRAEALPEFTESARLGRAQLAIEQQDHALALTLLQQIVKDNPTRHDLQANIKILKALTR